MSEVTQVRLRAVAVVSPLFIMLVVVLANQLTGLNASAIVGDFGQSVDLSAPGALADLQLSVWGSLLNVARLASSCSPFSRFVATCDLKGRTCGVSWLSPTDARLPGIQCS